MLAGATPLAYAPERKDTEALPAEIKAAVADLAKTIEDFRKKNDEEQKQFLKKGSSDVVSREEVDRINAGIDEAKAALQKKIDDLEAKANRLSLGAGTPEGQAEAKAARLFGEQIGKTDLTVDEFKTYRADLAGYIRRAEVKAATMQVATDPSGGFWVTPDVSGRMVKKIYDSTPMRQLANVVSIGTDRLEGPIDNGEGDAAWVGESQTRSGTTSPDIGMWAIDVNELYAYPKVTQKLLEDAKIDVEAWLADKASSKFARREATAFVIGDGVQKPKGFLQYAIASTDDASRPWGTVQYVPSGGAAGFAASNPADALINLIFELKAGYRQGAGFMMARRTQGAVRKLKDGQGNYLVDLRMRDGALVESIFGFPVTTGEDMPAIGANAYPIAFGDFAEAYTIVDRLGTSVVRDNITQPGFVKFHMRRRVGGGMVNFEALKLLKMATS